MATVIRNDEGTAAAGKDQLLKYELTPISDLRPAKRNARKHTKEQIAALARSIEAAGLISPVVRDAENRIVAGHGRVEAAKKLGLETVPTLLVDHLSDAERRLYAIADNAIPEEATWDLTLRAEEFRDLRIDYPDLDLTSCGLAHPVIELAIATLEQTAWSDLDICPEKPPRVPVTRDGDIWDFADIHTLVCGDCTSADAVAAAMRGEKIRIIEQDAPYNRRASEYSGKGKVKHDDFRMGAGEMTFEQYREFLSKSFAAALPYLTDGALIYGFMDGKHIGDLIEAGLRNGFDLKTVLVWDKGSAGLGGMYRSTHELIALFKHGDAAYVNNVTATRGSGRDRQTIWRYPGLNRFGKGRDRALSLHPTIKPVQLLCDLFLDASRPGEIVFDGFGGSGSTLIAAHHTGRKGRLVELEPAYCDVAIERFRIAFGSEPVERKSRKTFSELTALRRGNSETEVGDGQ